MDRSSHPAWQPQPERCGTSAEGGFIGPVKPEDMADAQFNPIWDDDLLEIRGYLTGLSVWAEVKQAMADREHQDHHLVNGMLWSLREAVRNELLEELGMCGN